MLERLVWVTHFESIDLHVCVSFIFPYWLQHEKSSSRGKDFFWLMISNVSAHCGGECAAHIMVAKKQREKDGERKIALASILPSFHPT